MRERALHAEQRIRSARAEGVDEREVAATHGRCTGRATSRAVLRVRGTEPCPLSRRGNAGAAAVAQTARWRTARGSFARQVRAAGDAAAFRQVGGGGDALHAAPRRRTAA